jgi:two-component system response regulator FixJ
MSNSMGPRFVSARRAERLISAAAETVYLIDDDPAVLAALRAVVEAAGLRARTFARAGEFLAEYDGVGPGCVVTDVRLPGISGIELQRTLAERQIGLPVVLITGHADVPTAVRAMADGAVDFLEKPFDQEALVVSVRRALAHGANRRRALERIDAIAAKRRRLTERERDVMDSLVVGRQNKEIAYLLAISPRTVEKYRARVMAKMQATNLCDLVQMALALPEFADALDRR